MNTISPPQQNVHDDLLMMIARFAYKFGEFTLSSGLKSKHYVNCKPVSLSGKGLRLVSLQLLEKVEPDALAVAGLTLGADPLVSGVALTANQLGRHLDAIIVRKQAKDYGTASCLEGPLPSLGSKITVLEDVITTGASSIKAVKTLREAGYLVERVISIVDRQEGGEVNLNEVGLELKTLFLLDDVVAKAQQILK